MFAQNIDWRGGSNEYPQCIFWSENEEIKYTPANPIFTIKVGYKGVFIAWTSFPDGLFSWQS